MMTNSHEYRKYGNFNMDNNQYESVLFEPVTLEKVLQVMNEQGGFEAAVLVNSDGLPIATVQSFYDTDTTAAMAGLLQRVSKEARDQLAMAEVDEVTIFDHNRIRLVCRYLVVGKEELILAVMVPPNRQYRRVTNRAVKQIKELISGSLLPTA